MFSLHRNTNLINMQGRLGNTQLKKNFNNNYKVHYMYMYLVPPFFPQIVWEYNPTEIIINIIMWDNERMTTNLHWCAFHFILHIINKLMKWIRSVTHAHMHAYTHITVFDKLIWRIIGQRASYLAHFGPVNYDYIVTNSINALIISSRCISNGAHTNHCSNLAHALRHIKNSDSHTYSPEANKDNICTCT